MAQGDENSEVHMHSIRNIVFVGFVLVAAATGNLSASNAADSFAQAFNCGTPTYWSTGQCMEGAVTMYCAPGEELWLEFCDAAEVMCDAHCGQYSAEGDLYACFAPEPSIADLDCQCLGTCQ
jgi:hypothetical protein